MEIVKRSLKLNILSLTKSKLKFLKNLENEYKMVLNLFKSGVEYFDELPNPEELLFTKYNLHNLLYDGIRKDFAVQSQLVIDAITNAWSNRKEPCARIKHPAIPFNIPRSGNFGMTERRNPIAIIAINGSRLGIPIAQDGAWKRFMREIGDGWMYTHFKLCYYRKKNKWCIIVTIKKDFEVESEKARTVLGIDVGCGALAAVSIIDDNGNPVRQLYFGQDVASEQRDISLRRSMLKSHADKGNYKAMLKLRKLRGYETNFVKTRCYQVAHEIVRLAKHYNSVISIERLRSLSNRTKQKKKLGKKSRKKVNRMPYAIFKEALISVAHQSGIEVVAVKPHYTSQTCSPCGARKKSYRKGSIFKCGKCGYIANADRNASVNIARKLLLERHECLAVSMSDSCQISRRDGPVNGHGWNDEGRLGSCSQHAQSSEFKPRPLGRGN
jgi:IS605 OrfB family transposase